MPNEPCLPFLFILTQLDAAEETRQKESIEPPKRPRGRPPKVEEPPLLPGAYRHILSDDDSDFDKQLLRAEKPSVVEVKPCAIPPVNGLLAVIVPICEKYACVCDGKVIGTSKYKDYWEYHYARGDLKIAEGLLISKFVRVTSSGKAESVASARHLKEKGVKGSMLPLSEVTSEDAVILTDAIAAVLA